MGWRNETERRIDRLATNINALQRENRQLRKELDALYRFLGIKRRTIEKDETCYVDYKFVREGTVVDSEYYLEFVWQTLNELRRSLKESGVLESEYQFMNFGCGPTLYARRLGEQLDVLADHLGMAFIDIDRHVAFVKKENKQQMEEITLSVSLDTSGFDEQMKKLKKSLRDMEEQFEGESDA